MTVGNWAYCWVERTVGTKAVMKAALKVERLVGLTVVKWVDSSVDWLVVKMVE